MNQREKMAELEYNESKDYFDKLGCAPKWEDCKCKGNGWCELHDHFDPEYDGYAV